MPLIRDTAYPRLAAVPFCAKTGTIRPPRPAASMAMLVSDAHANSPLAVKRFAKAGSRPGRGTRLEKPSSSELSFLASTGRQPHHALGGRLQELLRQLLVIDSAREDHRADHCRKNRHGLAAGLLALSFINPKAEQLEVFPDPGFE